MASVLPMTSMMDSTKVSFDRSAPMISGEDEMACTTQFKKAVRQVGEMM